MTRSVKTAARISGMLRFSRGLLGLPRAVSARLAASNELRSAMMARFKLVVLANPTDGREEEFNEWYSNIHLADIVAVPGFRSAQRFKLKEPMGFEHRQRYLAIYEMECDDPQAVVETLYSLRDTPAMILSGTLDLRTIVSGLFEPCSPVVTPAQESQAGACVDVALRMP
jgi:hypothetical protein